MKYGIIYRYRNKINNKNYIGQTTETLERRHQKHLHPDKKDKERYFHRALKKYGESGFELIVLENNILEKDLDEREIFWIKKFDSYYTSGNGYNMTKGGKWSTPKQIISGSSEKEIKRLLTETNLSYSDISKKFNVSTSAIGDISLGRTFYDKNLSYPLRKNNSKKSILKAEDVSKIITLLKENKIPISEIASIMNTKEYTVMLINRGKSKTYCPEDINYPIRKGIKYKTFNNKISIKTLYNIYMEILNGNQYIEIGKKFNVAKNTISDIARGITWKNDTLKYPLRKYKEYNISIIRSWDSLNNIEKY